MHYVLAVHWGRYKLITVIWKNIILWGQNTDSFTHLEMILSQGAEGRVIATEFLGKDAVCKERLRKRYRVPFLDEKLNKQRILQEARCINRCFRHGVSVPMYVFNYFQCTE